jgi:hypothetical protein
LKDKSLFERRLEKNKGKILAEVVFEEECCDGHSRETLMKLNNNYFRNHIFTPPNMLKEIDLQGGVLNYSGIELLTLVERLANPDAKKTRYRSILPSKSEI